MTRSMKVMLFSWLCSCIFPNAWATTYTSASCSSADFNTQISAASNGDTVRGPSGGGSATWSAQVKFSKGITLDGNGCVITLPSNTANLDVTAVPTSPLEIKNFTFNGASGNNDGQVIVRGLTQSTATCRIDNNTFQNGDAEVTTVGHGSCLIDHNSFTSSGGGAQVIIIDGGNYGDYSPRKDDQIPGSGKFVFIEDNTITDTSSSTYGQIQAYYGGSFVLRYNHLYNVGLETHGSSPGTCAGENGARWFEVYNNDHHPSPGITLPIKFRGGSGIVFGNTSDIPDHLILAEDCGSGTWPIQGQVGQGINPSAASGGTTAACCWSPLYAWNNSGFPVENNNSNLIQYSTTPQGCSHPNNRCDAVVTTSQPTTLLRCQSAADQSSGCPVSYTYTPYTYPYPLTTSAGSPSPPAGLTAVVE